MMKAIHLVLGITLFACCHVNSAPLDVLCGDESCLAKECTHYSSPDKYSTFIDLFTLKDAQPQDYLARIPFYVHGHRDAYIVLSPKKNPDWNADNVYEILIGSSSKRVIIRRERDGSVLKELQIPNAIDTEKTTRFLLEISVGGEIVLYSSQFADKPLLVTRDPNPLPVRYISFGANVDYFYNCKKDGPFKAAPKHPLLSTGLLTKADVENPMDIACSRYDTWDYNYGPLMQLSDMNPLIQSEEYLLRFPFYVLGKKQAYILLSPIEHPTSSADVYEIVIGASGMFHVQIRRHIGRDVIARIGRPNLLNDKVPVKFVLEIAKSGSIALYSSHDPFTPLIIANDPTPLPIKYFSFASKDSMVQYFYGCADDNKSISDKPLPVLPVELPSRFADNSILGAQATPKYDLQSCKHVQVQENEYQKFIPLEELVGEISENQIINLPLLVQGGKNAHIALASSEKPNWQTDNIYEFIIGGWDNSRVVVRRRKNGELLEEEEIMNTINKKVPTKFTLSITPAGKIFVFSDLSAYKPLIWTSDPDPLQVKYISFASNQSEHVDFYYGCADFTHELPIASGAPLIADKTLAKKATIIDVHPMLENPLLYDDIDLRTLAQHSKSMETWDDSYDSFIDVKNDWRPNGFMLRFVFYVQSIEGAHILLSTKPKMGIDNQNVYEILLGNQGNTLSQIVRKYDAKVLAEAQEQNILSENEPLRVIVEISNDGVFNVYTAHNPFAPLLQTSIPPLTQINFIGFASLSHSQFYYDLREDDMLSKPIEMDTVSENLEKVKHPLLALNDYPIGFSELFFEKYFHVFHTTPDLNDKYSPWIKLTDIGGVRPDGYLLRFPFYIQGPASAHILASPIQHPSLEDDAYEFLIGGLDNNRVEIRKRINGISLVNVRVPNVLSEWAKKKFVIEISNKGDIKLYSEDNPYRPLAVAFDPAPPAVNYISFKGRNSENLQFYYGNSLYVEPSRIVAELLAGEKSELSVHPMLRQWNNDLNIDVKALAMHSKNYETINSVVEFMPINTKYIQKSYALSMPVYLLGSSDAIISLSNVRAPSPNDKVYKIAIGAKDNAVSSISIGDVVKTVVYEQKLLSAVEVVKVILEITNDGWIHVFTSHNPYKPLMSYLDTNLIDVKFVSYWSPLHLQVSYDKDLLIEPMDAMHLDVVKHPLLTVRDYPIGLAEPFFAKYFKLLQTKPNAVGKYVDYVDLKEIENIRSDDYILRMPFYVRAKANVHLLLSKKPNPTKDDDAYEIVIGGWDNIRTIIRKRVNGAVLADVLWPNLLSAYRRKKFVIEITAIGDLKLFAEDDLYHPIVHAFDVNPVAVQFMSIKNDKGESIDLFYGNNWHLSEKNTENLIEEKYDDYLQDPLFRLYAKFADKLTMPILWQHSKYYESWSPFYTKFFKLGQSWPEPESDERFRFPVIVQGSKDARILLSSTQKPDALDENVYEIRVGGEDNSLISIGRKIDGVIMAQVHEQNILSPVDLTLLVVEISTNGLIAVWSSHNVYAPLLYVVDPKPLDVKYVSFASSTRMQFFYDFSLDELKHIVPWVDVPPTVYDKHPLFVGQDYPIGVSNLYFKKYTKEYVTLPEQPDRYVHFAKLNDIQGVRPEGYLIRFPFYVKGSKMAHAMVSTVEHPTEYDDAYEVVIGDKENSHVILRKRINGAVLADAYWPNILSEYKRTKFVFQVRDDGLIELFSEYDIHNPLLTAFDPVPIKMEYFSAKNWLPEEMVFNYGNLVPKDSSELEKIKNDLMLSEYKTLDMNPLWSHYRYKESYTLIKNGKYYESLQDVYQKVLPVGEMYKPLGYVLRFPIYTQGVGVAKFILSSVEQLNADKDIYYEIEIGNAWSRILKNGVELTRVYEQNLMNAQKPTEWFFEMSTDGLIRVFSSHNKYMPLMTAIAKPIDVQYISLASQSRIEFFYEVNEDPKPSMPLTHIPASADSNYKNPLLNVVDYPLGLTDLYFEKYYKTIVSDPEEPTKYNKWIKFDESGFEDIRPEGYFLRIPFYLYGANDAHIIVSSKENPTALDDAYEFVIGGRQKGHVVIRKRLNGPVLADYYWPNTLSVWRKKKFVLEIQQNNYISLYSEDLPHMPIASTNDWIPETAKFNFLSVKNIYGKQLSLSYAKRAPVVPKDVFMDLLRSEYGKVEIRPQFKYWKKLQDVDLKALTQNGKYVESWKPSFEKFIPIGDTYKPKNYLLQFPIWIQADQAVRLMFSSNNSVDGAVFDIYIGGNDNTLLKVHTKQHGRHLYLPASAQNILPPSKPLKLLIEATVGKVLMVYSSQNPFVPLFTYEYFDEDAPINYVSFASATESLSQFVYDVDEDSIAKMLVNRIQPMNVVKHPLLATRDYPIGFSKLFFQDYLQQIKTTAEGNETKWLEMSDFDGLRPKGYLARVPFYIEASREAEVVFAEKENPTKLDNAYELMIGGYWNSRVVIRKRINGAILADVQWSNVLSSTPKKFVFEAKLSGDLNLYSEDNPIVPLVTAFDPNPFSINYLAYRTLFKQDSAFYISGLPLDRPEKIRKDLLQKYYSSATVHPLLQNWNSLAPRITLEHLAQYGKYYESFMLSYSTFIPIADQYRSFDYKLRYPLYIAGESHAQILLSAIPDPGPDDDVYEITIGWLGNTRAKISNRLNGGEEVKVTELGVLSAEKAIKLIVDVSMEGVVSVYTSHNPWVPLLSASFPTKINVKYISFASYGRVQFFHDVDEVAIQQLPIGHTVATEVEAIDHAKHPLLAELDYPIGMAELFFKKFYNKFGTTPAPVTDKYVLYLNTDFVDATPANYIARVPFYIRGNGDAYVLFSATAKPTPCDEAYDLLIGGWNNKYVVLRKRIDGSIVAKTYWPNIISASRRTKFVFEVTVDGHVKLYSDVSPYKPLLSFFDPKPVHIKAITFKSDSSEKIEFFWGKNPSKPTETVANELISSLDEPEPMRPEFANWKKIVPVLNVKNLLEHSVFYFESLRSVYYMPGISNWKSDGFPLRIPVYIQGSADARIVLASVEEPTVGDSVYEIRIGGENNALSWISKQIDGEPVTLAFEENLLSPLKAMKVLIEVSADGLIEVFTSHNPYVPLISWKDPNPLQINHIGFASGERIEFFYDVDEIGLLNAPYREPKVSDIKHPLLSNLDITHGLKDMLSKHLIRLYEALPLQSNEYTQYAALADFEGAQPPGYIMRWPFSVQGPGNAHILVSPIMNPTESDDAYEIVIGAWGNHHITLRKRINGAVLADVHTPHVLSETELKKFVLDITEDGRIELFSDDDWYNPIISAYEVLPVKVKYVSFKNLLSEKLSFYYGFYPSEKLDRTILIKNPLLADPLEFDAPFEWRLLQHGSKYYRQNMLKMKLLAQNSKYYEAWDKVYRNPFELAEKHQPAGYLARFPMYLQGSHDAYIRLTTSSNLPTEKDDVYEIVLGSTGSPVHHLKKNGELLASENELGILSQDKPVRISIQITTDGAISVFTANNPYAPLLHAIDSEPVKIKFVHFATMSHMQYFYDIDDSSIIANKDKFQLNANEGKSVPHPLIVPLDVPSDAEDIYFKNHFKVYEPLVSNKYETWLKLSDIEHVKPPGFLVQFPFFVQGSSNAHAVFSPVENPSEYESMYEVVMGGFGNTRVMIRKQIDGALLADAVIPNILSVLKKKQFIFEVLTDGEIRLFGEDPYTPLLVAYDPKPLHVAYFSFKNVNEEKLSFFYGFNPEQLPNVIFPVVEPTTKQPLLSALGFRPILPQLDVLNVRKNIRDNLLSKVFSPNEVVEKSMEPISITNTIGIKDPKVVKYEPVEMHPLLEDILPVDFDLSKLVKNSGYVETWSNGVHTPLVKVSGSMQSNGFNLRFPFYVRGLRDATVRLWTTDKPSWDHDHYEIYMGAAGNMIARIVRVDGASTGNVSSKVLTKIVEGNVLNEWQLTKMVIEVTNAGVISLYTGRNRWAPLLTVVDPNPLNVKYISFGSDTLVQYFYDVNEKIWPQSLPVIPAPQLEHPLFSAITVPIGYEHEWLNKYFKVIDTSKSTHCPEEQLINLDDLKMAKSNQFKVRLPLFINGTQNARIYLAPKGSIALDDDAYVIDIGSLMNSNIRISKRLNGPILASAVVPNVLSNVNAKLFVIEVSEDGWIHVFNEDDHVKPLISTFDPYPVDVNYVGFSSTLNEPVRFYYDYDSRPRAELLLNQMIPFKYNSADLMKKCKLYVSESAAFKTFIAIGELGSVQRTQFAKTFSIYVDGSKDVSIVLADSLVPKRDSDFIYEILIGSIFEKTPIFVRHKLDDPLRYDALVDIKLVKIDVEIGNGKIRIFRDYQTDSWLEESYDVNVDLDYVSFGAPSGAQSIYYGCSL